MLEQRTLQPWAVRIPWADRHELFRLAGLPLQVACHDQFVWVQGEYVTESILRWLAMLPGPRFEIDDKQNLSLPGNFVPTERLPDGPWQPIDSVLHWTMQAPALTLTRHDPSSMAQIGSRPRCQLLRNGEFQPAAAMIIDLLALAQWCAAAPLVRIEALRWLYHPQGRSLVIGAPLPIISGDKFWQCGKFLLPLGFSYSPSLPVHELELSMNLGAAQLGLWQENETVEVIENSDLRPLSRSSVRLALREVTL